MLRNDCVMPQVPHIQSMLWIVFVSSDKALIAYYQSFLDISSTFALDFVSSWLILSIFPNLLKDLLFMIRFAGNYEISCSTSALLLLLLAALATLPAVYEGSCP